MKKKLLFTLCFFPWALLAQSDSLQAEEWVRSATRMLKESKMDSAALFHRQALGQFLLLDLPYRALSSYRSVYAGFANQNKPIILLDSLEAGLAALPRQPKTKKEHAGLCNYLLYIGFVYQIYLSDYQSARYYYERAYKIFQADLHEQDDDIAKFVYLQLGNAYTRLGDYGRAKALLKKAIRYGEVHGLPEMKAALTDVSIVYFEEGSLDSAKAVLDEALALPNSNAQTRMLALDKLASYWLEKDNPEQALLNMEKAAVQLDSIQAKGTSKNYLRRKAEWLRKMGAIYQKMGQHETALDFVQQSIAPRLESQSGERSGRELAKAFLNASSLLLDMGRHSEALQQTQLAFQCLLPDFHPSADENPDPESFYPENTLFEALEQKAVVLEKMGRLDESLACYTLIPVAEAKLRETYQYEASSLMLIAEGRERLERAIGIARLRYDQSGDARYAAQAFYLSEQARGGLLLGSLAASTAAATLPEAQRLRERELRSRMTWYELEIAATRKKGKNNELEVLENTLFLLKQQNAALQDTLRTAYPQYAALRRGVDFATVFDVPLLLQPGRALASFLLNDSLLNIFFFDPSGQMTWRTTPISIDFFFETEGIAAFLGSEDQSPAAKEVFKEHAHSLYRILLGPELAKLGAGITNLVVVPDGALSYLPFEVLLEQPAKVGQGFADLAFLLKTKSVSSLPSVTLAKWQAGKGKHLQAPEPFAGFAPKYGDALASVRGDSIFNPQDSLLERPMWREGLYDLPGAREEVRQIQAITGGDNYSGELATKAAFLENAGRYRNLHLAMHALTDRKNPLLARFVFTQQPGDKEMDYLLFASELGNLSLRADLAVLSACNTGVGRQQRGEGVYNLARSFMLAGVPSVVMSLWRLPDSATREVMVGFYHELNVGKTKAEALRLTKLAYLDAHQDEPQFLHPFFWAGLTLAGW
ncbi:MAG: CHAT domain-containing protein [Saprospiraceae bacterium]|nr:CHAT domain-containing protein [Saprospiraceae bacterium]